METTILQIPISKNLRDKAVLAAEESGFSSLQEVVRVFLKQFAHKEVEVVIEPKPVQLSKKAIRRYNKISDEIASGKAKLFTAHSVEELMDHLNK